MNTKINWWRWLCIPITIVSIALLINKGFTWWQAVLIIFCPAFANYLDGLYRGKKMQKESVVASFYFIIGIIYVIASIKNGKKIKNGRINIKT